MYKALRTSHVFDTTLKLYGSPLSTSTKRAIGEKRPIRVYYHRPHQRRAKAPGFVNKQPFGQFPFINGEGFILYESRAIERYITSKYASQCPSLIPASDLKTAVLFEQPASSELANFDRGSSTLVREMFQEHSMIGEEADETVVAEDKAKLDGTLDVHEIILSKQPYVAGNELALPDLFHLPCGARVKGIFLKLFSSRPYIRRRLENLECRSSWQAVKDELTSST
ncbi:glutathione S-transferase [Athelia psychrophila]|uniref:glutathione transferase n=1 Tax=Athelia psychrophila TaxID=1759441 RepID=A0A166D216_9AGAM|nr:glutathione S-transferase [Fibularhizoctonia sp. CBS 109695]